MKLIALPAASRRIEPWANGSGQTAVILREPAAGDWRVRISIAQVERDGPFSDLPDTRRLLVPLDAPMELRFPDGQVQRTNRFGVLRFAGAPAPYGVLPEGPTRDFNLMLRHGARGELFARTLVDSMVLPPEADARWLVYLHRGSATISTGATRLELAADDAAVLAGARAVIEGAGELVVAKLYA
ncbi:MAG TPA: HutD family protein [Rhodanobacteraceae bacterium]|nr:HutD family protein [Rhodanobacteraceae bacterium]